MEESMIECAVVLEKPDLKIKYNKISPHYCTGQRGVLQSLSS